ncbi:MAG: methyltransferase domain-containing protein [Thermovirgaceae bacterium]
MKEASFNHETQQYYRNNARALAQRYARARGGIELWFDAAFPKGSKILDVGAAAGRDVLLLLEAGYDACGVDPCRELVAEGLRANAALKDRLACDALPGLETIADHSFDGVLCSAVLMHLPEETLFDAAFGLRRVLRPGGRLLVSLPVDASGEPIQGRDEKGRLFNGLSPDRLELMLTRLGFTCIGRGENFDSLGREGRKWLVQLFVLETDGAERSIDRIESVLNRDRKVATYKLALFRALAEIGMTRYNQVRWVSGGMVALPITTVAQKWLEFYWPIVASEDFIPQIQGEHPESAKPIAFRHLLKELIQRFQLKGGLPAFLLASRTKILESDERTVYKKLLTKLCQTIRAGPVTYSGGGGTPQAVFGYDPHDGYVLMPKEIWQDFCLMGAWIRDATILRWAELTERLAKREISAGRVIGLLIEDSLPEREVADTRRVFKDTGRCVWTGQPLRAQNLEIDHAIPFSLWHCNDLWNLFPASTSANRAKRDKLPTHRLILARKKAIQEIWQMQHDAFPNRFDTESSSFAGIDLTEKVDWPESLFSFFSEAVEVTAIQRGAERWEP